MVSTSTTANAHSSSIGEPDAAAISAHRPSGELTGARVGAQQRRREPAGHGARRIGEAEDVAGDGGGGLRSIREPDEGAVEERGCGEGVDQGRSGVEGVAA